MTTRPAFKDHFSGQADAYQRCRPEYPPALFDWIAAQAPALAMRADWDAGAMLGYLDTWSAVRRHRARTGRNPLALLSAPLVAAWGRRNRPVRWPLSIRAGRA